jgi:hypothetical protein
MIVRRNARPRRANSNPKARLAAPTATKKAMLANWMTPLYGSDRRKRVAVRKARIADTNSSTRTARRRSIGIRSRNGVFVGLSARLTLPHFCGVVGCAPIHGRMEQRKAHS